MTNKLNATERKISLKINNQKTDFMEIAKESRREVLINTRKIERLNFFTYLRIIISSNSDAEKDVINKAGKLMGVFQISETGKYVEKFQIHSNTNSHLCKRYLEDDKRNNQACKRLPSEVPDKNSRDQIKRRNNN